MTEGWGTSWLPVSVQRRIAVEEARDAVAERERQAERERVAEDRHARALDLHREAMAARGVEVSALDYATGKVPGRTVADVLGEAVTAMARQDQVDAARLHRDGHGEPEKIHVEFGEPVLHGLARSEAGWRIFQQARRFRAKLEARRALEAAEEAAERSRHDYGLIDGVERRGR